MGGELKKSGFCGIRHSGRMCNTSLAYYDAFVLRAVPIRLTSAAAEMMLFPCLAGVKSDRRLYLFNVGTEGQFVDGLYQSGFQKPQSDGNEWGKLTLPFASFQTSYEGFVRVHAFQCMHRARA